MNDLMNSLTAAIERQLRGPAFSRVLAGFGVEPRRYWLLMDLFHLLSSHGEMQGQLGRQSHALRLSTAFFLLFSVAAAGAVRVTGGIDKV